MKQKHWILVAVLLVASLGLATYLLTPRAPVNMYVALTGSDTSDCRSLAAPCATIAYALDQCVAGDTIHVRAGLYHTDPSTVGEGNGDVFSYLHDFCDGTPEAWITITAYEPTPGVFEDVTIRAINYDPTVSYHTWRRIKVTVSGRARTEDHACIRLADETHHIRLDGMECTGSLSSGGIGVGERVAFVEITGTCGASNVCTCKSHDNGDNVELDHGFYISGDDVVVDGCQMFGNAAYGLQFWAEGGNVAERVILRNSFITGNGVNSPNGGGVAIGGTNDALIENVVIAGNHDGLVSLNGRRHRIHNSTVVNNSRFGVEVQTGSDHESVNNIIWNNRDGDQRYLVSLAVASHNLCQGAGTDESPTCAVEADPMFVDPATDVRLQPKSPAIGAGLDLEGGSDALGTPRPFPAAGAVDLGALEYRPTRPPVPPEPPPTDLVRLLCEALTHPDLSAGTWLLCHQQAAGR